MYYLNSTNMNTSIESGRKGEIAPWITILLLSIYEYVIDYAKYKVIHKQIYFLAVFVICIIILANKRKYKVNSALSGIYIFIVFAIFRMTISDIDFTYLLHWICILIAMGVGITDLQYNRISKLLIIGGVIISFSCILHMLAPNQLYSIGELFLDTKWKTEATRFSSWLQYTGLTYQTGTSANIAVFGLSYYFSSLAYRKKSKVEIIIILVCFYVGIALTSKRMMFIISLMIPLIVYMCKMTFDGKKASNRFVAFSSIMIISFIGISVFLPYLDNVNVIRRFFIADLSDANRLANGRIDLYKYAIDMFKENPLWGAGWGAYGAQIGMGAHNVYLQLLSETGIIGFSIYMIAVIRVFMITLKKVRTNKQSSDITKTILTFSLVIQIVYLMYSFSGNALYELPMKTVYFYSCAIGVSAGESSRLTKVNMA